MTTTYRSDIVIDHGVVPIEVKRGKECVYPFRDLSNIGDAMFIPVKDVTETKDNVREKSLRSLCVYWSRPKRWPDGKARRYTVRYIKHATGRYGYQVTRTV